jgi:hypothetical protein
LKAAHFWQKASKNGWRVSGIHAPLFIIFFNRVFWFLAFRSTEHRAQASQASASAQCVSCF